ncbi:MAG: peptidase M20, partial [Thermobifida fusca]|nr:peptidase M20 [Thermobifida fusca]
MDVRAHIEAHRDEFVATLSQWLAIPSISADPAHHDDVRRSAQWLADHFTQTGFPTVEIWETPGMPAVFAEWPAADPEAPTVLVYGHHDVQPVDPVDAWHTDP